MNKKMINKMIAVSDIQFEECLDEALLASIRKRGVAIPVKVNVVDGGYVCVDGNKRLTALKRLANENEKFLRVNARILNDYSKAGSAYWGNTQNHH